MSDQSATARDFVTSSTVGVCVRACACVSSWAVTRLMSRDFFVHTILTCNILYCVHLELLLTKMNMTGLKKKKKKGCPPETVPLMAVCFKARLYDVNKQNYV